MTLPIPTEAIEQRALVRWLDLKGYKYTAIPNSTYTTSWKQKAHNRAMGLRSGFPDMVIIAQGKFMCVELKRLKGSNTYPTQLEWIEALNSAGIPAAICKGADEAIRFIESVVRSR